MKNIHLGTLCVSSLFSSFPATLFAVNDDPFFEMPVVLSASRLAQPISETPVAVTSIDRELIEASGARSIPDILRLVPGMIVGYSANEWGEEAKTVVSYQGHTDQYSRRMQVLIDGRSIYEPLLGGVAWNMLPINIDDIERIEVVRGPNASTFGSNSFLGVVNIITRHAAEDPGHFVKANAGNHGIRDLTYRFGGNEGDLNYRITLSTQNDDGQSARKISAHQSAPFNILTKKLITMMMPTRMHSIIVSTTRLITIIRLPGRVVTVKPCLILMKILLLAVSNLFARVTPSMPTSS